MCLFGSLCVCVLCSIYMSVGFGVSMCVLIVFFFKQKTAYELRISDLSSDVCSSDLQCVGEFQLPTLGKLGRQPRLCTLTTGAAGVAIRREIGRASCRDRVCQYV